MTQLEYAKKGIVTEVMKKLALQENVAVEFLMNGIASGKIVILFNKKHKKIQPIAIGEGLRVKINANIGSSSDQETVASVIEKVNKVIECKSDTLMDLSIVGDLDKLRKTVIENCSLPVGSCPVYQVFGEAIQNKKSFSKIPMEKFLEVIEKHAKDGISFMGLHCAMTREGVSKIKNRLMGIVSRGGGLMECWMRINKTENPLYSEFDKILKILKKFDIVLDISDCLRPGCINDANDDAHIFEISIAGELIKKAQSYGVGVMTEGPGHMPFDQIEYSIKLQKKLNYFVPLYMLGPLVIDAAPGYDHIVSAIGATAAGYAGADFLCVVTPSEHLGLPDLKDLETGIYAMRTAGLAIDTARKNKQALEQNNNISLARFKLDWPKQAKYSICNKEVKDDLKKRTKGRPCSMCGKFCPMKINSKFNK